jgi:hypothetical protein
MVVFIASLFPVTRLSQVGLSHHGANGPMRCREKFRLGLSGFGSPRVVIPRGIPNRSTLSICQTSPAVYLISKRISQPPLRIRALAC